MSVCLKEDLELGMPAPWGTENTICVCARACMRVCAIEFVLVARVCGGSHVQVHAN